MMEPVELVALPTATFDEASLVTADERNLQIINPILLYTIFGDQSTVNAYIQLAAARIAAATQPPLGRRRSSAAAMARDRIAAAATAHLPNIAATAAAGNSKDAANKDRLVPMNPSVPSSDSMTGDGGLMINGILVGVNGLVDEPFGDAATERFERAASSQGTEKCRHWFNKQFDNDNGHSGDRQRNLIDSTRAGVDPITFVELVMKISNLSHHEALDLFDIFGNTINQWITMLMTMSAHRTLCYQIDVEGSRVLKFEEFHLVMLFFVAYHCAEVAEYMYDPYNHNLLITLSSSSK
jgi:hypothetical protein